MENCGVSWRNMSSMVIVSCLFSLMMIFHLTPSRAAIMILEDVNGTYDLSPTINYSCATGLVNLGYSQFTFVDDGETLTIQPKMNNYSHMTGNSAINGNIDVSCAIFDGCDEIYTLQGAFVDNDTWQAVFKVQFSGALCSLTDCSDHTWNIEGTRVQETPEFLENQLIFGLLLILLLILPIFLVWFRRKFT
ncbi:MAG: hypothetical protein ACFFCQ_12060 [Promethearchaeota archaeon]